MTRSKIVFFTVCVIVVCLAAIGISTALAQETARENFLMLIGTVIDNEDEFVGLAIVDNTATIYICDGRADENSVSVAEWFIGEVENNIIDITALSGNRVEIAVAGDVANGRFTFTDGTTKTFVLNIAEGVSGLYRSEFELFGVEYVGGWLVLPDGTTRGAVRNSETGDLEPATLASFQQIGE
jgi:hypothetical protein